MIRDSFSLVIPAYNEQDRLSRTLESYLPALESIGVPFEVIVVADGRDNTPEVAAAFSDRHVVCLGYGRKLGRGGAIFEGFRFAQYAVVAFADADGSVPAEDVVGILKLGLSGKPAVIASRRLLPEMVEMPESAGRRLIGTIWHLLVRALLKLPVKDAQCGMKAFSHEVVREIILPQVTVTNRTFEVGMLYHVKQSGTPILEVPVKYSHDDRTRMPIAMAIPVMFVTLIGIFLFNVLLRGKYETPPLFVKKMSTLFQSV